MLKVFGVVAILASLLALVGCDCQWPDHWRTQSQIATANAISHGGLPAPAYSTAPLVPRHHHESD